MMRSRRTTSYKWIPNLPELDSEWQGRVGVYRTFVPEERYENLPLPLLKERILNGFTHIGVSRTFIPKHFNKWMDKILDKGVLRSPLSDILFGNIPYAPKPHMEIRRSKKLEAVIALMDFAFSASYWKMYDQQKLQEESKKESTKKEPEEVEA